MTHQFNILSNAPKHRMPATEVVSTSFLKALTSRNNPVVPYTLTFKDCIGMKVTDFMKTFEQKALEYELAYVEATKEYELP